MTDRIQQAKEAIASIEQELKTIEGAHGELSADQLLTLMSDLDKGRTTTRKQAGATLTYVEAHDSKSMMNRVFGFAQWSSESNVDLISLSQIDVPDTKWNNSTNRKEAVTDKDGRPVLKKQWVGVAKATVKVTILQTGAVYQEVAMASQNGIDPGEVGDFAVKTAESDAFKRATVFLGTQFGASLYASTKDKVEYADQVKVIFQPRQKRILELGRRRRNAQAFLASAPAAAPSAPQNPASAQTAAPGAQSSEQAAGSALQGAFNQGA